MEVVETAGEPSSEATAAPEAQEPVAQTEQVETSTEAQPEATDGEDSGQDRPKKTPWFQQRINELTREKYELRRQLEAREAPATQPQTGDLPRLEDFDFDFDRYQAAMLDYATRNVSSTIERQLSEREQRQHRAAAEATFTAKAAELAAKEADFGEAINVASNFITGPLLEAVVESEVGPLLALHLGRNPHEAARIASLPQHRALVELGKLEVSLSAPPVKPTPRNPPPAPPKPLAGIAPGSSTKSPDEMSVEEYRKWRGL